MAKRKQQVKVDAEVLATARQFLERMAGAGCHCGDHRDAVTGRCNPCSALLVVELLPKVPAGWVPLRATPDAPKVRGAVAPPAAPMSWADLGKLFPVRPAPGIPSNVMGYMPRGHATRSDKREGV